MACNANVAFGMCAYFASLVAQTYVCVPHRLGSSGQEAVGSKFNNRGVAQFGSALGSGPRGRGFESRHSDH